MARVLEGKFFCPFNLLLLKEALMVLIVLPLSNIEKERMQLYLFKSILFLINRENNTMIDGKKISVELQNTSRKDKRGT